MIYWDEGDNLFGRRGIIYLIGISNISYVRYDLLKEGENLFGRGII